MYDIVFISYEEPNAEDNYSKLKERFPMAKRVHGVKGIHQAHIAAAKKCFTKMFWIVDGDALILEDFMFDYEVPDHQLDHVHVWRAQNPINDLVYGYGGVKLFPRTLTLNMDVTKPDMTTSISKKFIAVQEVANITAFNTGEFEAWKGAFRECAKLASKIIPGQVDEETEKRLETWLTVGAERQYGKIAMHGAACGKQFGEHYRGNVEALAMLNDFDYLEQEFNEHKDSF